MRYLPTLFANNRAWAESQARRDPGFFDRLSTGQAPRYLWIGCADSRVPPSEVLDVAPGDLFVHRNVANVIRPDDVNCRSVIQYAVDVLKVKHIIVCGHYECGGIKAALDGGNYGLIDNWLRHIKDIYRLHHTRIEDAKSDSEKTNLMCELNVIEQVANVCHTTVVQSAWKSGQELAVHGWVYSVADGVLKDLEVTVTGADEISVTHRMK